MKTPHKPRKPDPKADARDREIRAAFETAFTAAIAKLGVEGLKRTSMFGRSRQR